MTLNVKGEDTYLWNVSSFILIQILFIMVATNLLRF